MASNPIPLHIHRFSVREIEAAIRHGREIGRGGFGVVYQGSPSDIKVRRIVQRHSKWCREMKNFGKKLMCSTQSHCGLSLFHVVSQPRSLLQSIGEYGVGLDLKPFCDRGEGMGVRDEGE